MNPTPPSGSLSISSSTTLLSEERHKKKDTQWGSERGIIYIVCARKLLDQSTTLWLMEEEADHVLLLLSLMAV